MEWFLNTVLTLVLKGNSASYPPSPNLPSLQPRIICTFNKYALGFYHFKSWIKTLGDIRVQYCFYQSWNISAYIQTDNEPMTTLRLQRAKSEYPFPMEMKCGWQINLTSLSSIRSIHQWRTLDLIIFGYLETSFQSIYSSIKFHTGFKNTNSTNYEKFPNSFFFKGSKNL